MIIRDIHIDGFGIFSGFSLTGLGHGVNIIRGNNEAGKSTLLKFIRYTLFGYPRFLDQRMAPLKGGQHGGRIRATLSSNSESVFERTGNDRIRLHFQGEETANQAQWFQLLGNASADLFNNVYAFSLDELVGMGSLNDSGVEDRIFSIGLGLGSTSLGDVERSISDKTDKIYKPRGSNQVIPGILGAMKDRQELILQVQDNLPAYDQLQTELRSLRSQQRLFQEQLKELQGKRAMLEMYSRCHDAYIAYVRSQEALSQLPPLQPYPEDLLELYQRAADREVELQEGIRDLQKGTGSEKGTEELKALSESITWNQALLDQEEVVSYLHGNLSRYKQTLTELHEEQQQINTLNRSIIEGLKQVDDNWTEQQATAFPASVTHRERIQQFGRQMEQLSAEKTALENEISASRAREGVVRAERLTMLVALALLIGSVPSFYYQLPVLGAALIAISLLVLAGKKMMIRRDILAVLSENKEKLEEAQALLNSQYQDYIQTELQLSGTWSPDTFTTLFHQVEQIKRDIRDRNQLQDKINQQRLPFVQDVEKKVEGLKPLLAHTLAADTALAIQQVIAAFQETKDSKAKQQQVVDELNRKNRAISDLKEKHHQVHTKINSFLEQVGGNDPEDFRRRVETNKQVKGLTEKSERAWETLEQLAGRGRAAEVISYLNQHDKLTLEVSIREQQALVAEETTAYEEILQQIGSGEEAVRKMEEGPDLATLLTEQEVDRQRLREAYSEWLSGRVALNLLSSVRHAYERDKQPEVIKNAGRVFEHITDGQYQTIRVTLDTRQVSVYDQTEASKQIAHLSRGTREQLLISLRLGFIEAYEKSSEPLPVVMDEVLVNFDPERAQQTARILQEFARERQLLVFTCRPETIDYFGKVQVFDIDT